MQSNNSTARSGLSKSKFLRLWLILSCFLCVFAGPNAVHAQAQEHTIVMSAPPTSGPSKWWTQGLSEAEGEVQGLMDAGYPYPAPTCTSMGGWYGMPYPQTYTWDPGDPPAPGFTTYYANEQCNGGYCCVQGIVEDFYCGPGVVWGGPDDQECLTGYWVFAPVKPDPAGNCPVCKLMQAGRISFGDPIEVGTGNMFLRETDFVGADKRLQFTRVYNSDTSSYTSSSTVGNGWQGELDGEHILKMDSLIPLLSRVYMETSPIFTSVSDACTKGWPAIVAGTSSLKPDPKWAGVTATYDGAGNCKLSNGTSVPVQGSGTTVGMAGSADVASRGIAVRLGDGSANFFYCNQGNCTAASGGMAPFKVTLDTTGYNIVNEDGDTEHYDYLGFLSTITYKDGYVLSFAYNNDNQGVGYLTPFGTPTFIKDNHGRTISFYYDQKYGWLNYITTPDGMTVSYGHDSHGRLTSVTNPTGTRTYNYAPTPDTFNTNLLTSLVDENGNTLSTWGYDSSGRATSDVMAGGANSFALTFNPDTSVTVKDALGTIRTFGFQNLYGFPQVTSITGVYCSACGGMGKAMTYDGGGFLKTSTDWNNNLSTYTYDDSSGLLNTLVEAQGTTQQRTTTTNWNYALANPTEHTVADNNNALQSKADWAYDNGSIQPTAYCEEDPTVAAAMSYTCTSSGTVPTGVRRWVYTYCTAIDQTRCPLVGLLLSVDGPRINLNDITTYTYYMNGASTCTATGANLPGDLCTVTNALGQVTTIANHDGAGRPTTLIDANNVETDLTYYPRGWLHQAAVRATNGQSGTGDQITSFIYDNDGDVKQITDPDGSYSVIGYDTADRLTDIYQYQSGLPSNLTGHIHYTLDLVGNRTREDTYDASGGTIKRTIQRVFNSLGQLQVVANANVANPVANPTYSYQYDLNGNPYIVTDGRGTVTNNYFDSLNRLYKIAQDPGTSPQHVAAYTTLTLDALDRTAVVVDPQGVNTQTSYKYDGFNDLTQLTSPDTGITKAAYDPAGNVLSRTDARGITANYITDALNRVTQITYPNTALNVSYTYDATQATCNQTTQIYSVGRLTMIQDGSGTTRFCYDRFGRMAHKQQIINGTTFFTSYVYDLANHLTQETTPSGTIIKYTRDGAGRVTAVTYRLSGQNTDTPLVTAVTYYPFGPVASITYANGRVLNRTYDQDYVISGVTDSGAGGLNLTFGRDVLGNLTQVNSSPTTGNILIYDSLNRLTFVNNLNNVQVAAYTYDATGNRLTKQATISSPLSNYSYPSNSHWLMGTGPTGNVIPRTYDAMGDTATIGTGAGSLGFLFDNAGRMNQVNNGSGTAVMQYATNAMGQRVEKYLTGNTGATQYTIDDETGHAIGDYNSTAARVRETVWMDGMPVGVLSGSAGALAYVEPDQIGTPRVAIDATTKASVWNWNLVNDPFGEVQPTGTLSYNLRMPGQAFDAERRAKLQLLQGL